MVVVVAEGVGVRLLWVKVGADWSAEEVIHQMRQDFAAVPLALQLLHLPPYPVRREGTTTHRPAGALTGALGLAGICRPFTLQSPCQPCHAMPPRAG